MVNLAEVPLLVVLVGVGGLDIITEAQVDSGIITLLVVLGGVEPQVSLYAVL
jgi:hypothetical protein